jgi:propanol-preferring alcohol dehydrogenase
MERQRAMVLHGANRPLRLEERTPEPPAPGEVLIRVAACGVCRTDLHIVDGELAEPRLPLVPGHEIVGRVVEAGAGVNRFPAGVQVGVPWLGWTCGTCVYCRTGRENLCADAVFTGYTRDGGYADFVRVDARYCFALPESLPDVEAAPLLCAGLIGYRALRMAGDAARIGVYGFGAAAHIVTQVARHQGREIHAFVRPGDNGAANFARALGAAWSGPSTAEAPDSLDAAIIFAPVGGLVPAALRNVAPGGRVVCAGIHMSDIPGFPYDILWKERQLVSVANLTRRDGEEFLALAPRVPVHTTTVPYPLEQANRALDDLRSGNLQGAAVLTTANWATDSRRPVDRRAARP